MPRRFAWLIALGVALVAPRAHAQSPEPTPPLIEIATPDTAINAHKGMVCALRVSPDGKRVASSSFDRSVRVSSFPEGEQIWKISVPAGGRGAIDFAPDGQALAGGLGDGAVLIWDAATGAERRRLGQHDRKVSGVAYAPDGRSLASVSLDGVLRCWDMSTGAERFRQVSGIGYPAAAITPDGRVVVISSPSGNCPLSAFEVATGKPVLPFGDGSCGISENTAALAFIDDQTVFTFDASPARRAISTGAAAWSNRSLVPGREIAGLAVVPGRNLIAVTAHEEPHVLMLDARTGALALQIALPSIAGRLTQIAFTPDGAWMLAAGQDGQVVGVKSERMWKAK